MLQFWGTLVPSENQRIDNSCEVLSTCSVHASRSDGTRGGRLCCFCSQTSVPTADFVLGTKPVGLGLTGLVALVLGLGVSCANTECYHVPWALGWCSSISPWVSLTLGFITNSERPFPEGAHSPMGDTDKQREPK